MDFSTIILAAGQGVRMQSSIPKVMHQVASKPLIGYIIAVIEELKTKENLIVIGPNMDILRDYVMLENGTIKLTVQEERLGTGDAVKVGLKSLNSNSDILVLYGDTPFIKPRTIKKMYELLHKNQQNALVVLGFIAKNPAKYGRLIVDQKDILKDIIEFLDCTEEQKKINLCNSGVMLIRKEYISDLLEQVQPNNAKKEYYLTDLVKIALSKNLTCCYLTIDEFEAVAINTREELARAEEIIQRQLRKKFIENGVTLIDQNSVHFASDTTIEPDVTIYPQVFFGPGVEVKSGSEIKSFSHLEGAAIGNNCIIGPFARVRPGTTLDKQVKIGNFVEVKNADIKQKTKINHLSYIGDISIGESTNIGAGTVICNYDGFNKHHTNIENNVFIGSNTTIISPVNIDGESIIGAGSVITENINKGDLAISRSKQHNIIGKAKEIRKKKLKQQSENKPAL